MPCCKSSSSQTENKHQEYDGGDGLIPLLFPLCTGDSVFLGKRKPITTIFYTFVPAMQGLSPLSSFLNNKIFYDATVG